MGKTWLWHSGLRDNLDTLIASVSSVERGLLTAWFNRCGALGAKHADVPEYEGLIGIKLLNGRKAGGVRPIFGLVNLVVATLRFASLRSSVDSPLRPCSSQTSASRRK
jgi:hypothetical protein